MKQGTQSREDVSDSALARELGSAAFRREFGLAYAYVAGGMYRGTSSEELVAALAGGRLLGFFGAGGLALERVDAAVCALARRLGEGLPWGVNFVHQPNCGEREDEFVALLLARRVRVVEASAFLQISPALIRYRAKGLKRGPDGSIVTQNRVFAKVSRPEIAQGFLSPPPERSLAGLVASGKISAEQAELARRIPMADALTVEGDSAGHTDKGVLLALLPAMIALRDQQRLQHGYAQLVHVGAAGGLGAPRAVAAAFALGADYVVTGSINQCTVESGASEAVKDMLQSLDVQDVAMAPAGDMFEIGARVQVVRRGTLFAARASKLYELYRQHESLDAIDVRTRRQLEEKVFRASWDTVFREVEEYFAGRDKAQLDRARTDPKHKMALVFRWYLAASTRFAAQGDLDRRVDFQVHCGPAMGAFNAIVRKTALEPWRNRHVARIGTLLMNWAARDVARTFGGRSPEEALERWGVHEVAAEAARS